MTKESKLLNIAVLGAGAISQAAHFEACQKARNARLYAICDLAPDLLQSAVDTYKPEKAYRDADAMLADPQVDAVLIGVADQFHVPLSLKAVAGGRHVLVEKPMATTVEEALELCRAVEASGCVLQVGHNRRFDPGVEFAHQFVAGELGRMQSYKGWYYDSTSRYAMTDNLQPLIKASGSAKRPAGDPKADRRRYFMLTHGSHLLDTARFLAGEIVAVRARHNESFGAHCWFIEIAFSSGALGHADLHVPIHGDYEEGFSIAGEFGSVHGRLPLTWYHKGGDVECFSIKDGLYRRPLGADAFSYRRQVESFADVILNGAKQTGANVYDGLAGMRAMVAIARSVESGETVPLASVIGGV